MPDTGFPDAAAWAEMLARIASRNNQLNKMLQRDSLKERARSTDLLQELESERSRIARDLHAGAGQPLAGIRLNLELLEESSGALSGGGREALNRLHTLSEAALEQVRSVSHRLHPPEWQGLNVGQAIRTMVYESGVRERFSTEVDVEETLTEPFHAAKVVLYRCAQECLSNVLRHSAAKRLRISLREAGDCILLKIMDDGVGIPMDPDRNAGIGLRAIREHVGSIGGTSSVWSGSHGTTIVIEVPVREQQDEE